MTPIASIRADLEELTSRGSNHPQASELVSRIRVALDQAADAMGAPPPPADPVQDQLARLNLAVAALGEAVGPIVQRQQDVAHELGIIGAAVARISDQLTTLQASESGKTAAGG